MAAAVPPTWNKVLRRIEENDPLLRGLRFKFSVDRDDRAIRRDDDSFASLDISDDGHVFFYVTTGRSSAEFFARLGAAVGNNTQLDLIDINGTLGGEVPPGISNNAEFLEGLKRNSSIRSLLLFGLNLSDEGVCGLLDRLGQSNSNFTRNLNCIALNCLRRGDGNGEGVDAFQSVLRKCTSLTELVYSQAIDVEFDEVVEAIEDPGQLERIVTPAIGRVGFEALAPLLRGTNGNLRELKLHIGRGDIGMDTVATVLAKSSSLEGLDLGITVYEGPEDWPQSRSIDRFWDCFAPALCDKSTMNGTYFSNHTLKRLFHLGSWRDIPGEVSSIVATNGLSNDKKLLAFQKVLRYHPNFDMTPLFEWDLKVLPNVIEWFERGRYIQNIAERQTEARGDGGVASGSTRLEAYWLERSRYIGFLPDETVGKRKLFAIYQFIHAMPEVCESTVPSASGERRTKRRSSVGQCGETELYDLDGDRQSQPN